MDKRYGKNPDGLGETLHKLAIKCRTEHKYETAKQLELEVIKLAQSSKGNLKAGLPAFYSFLAMNEFVQDKTITGQKYFLLAKSESLNIKGAKEKSAASLYFEGLNNPIVLDQDEGKYALAESEFSQLIDLKESIFSNPIELFQPYSRLAALLNVEHRFKESLLYLKRCIAVAEIYQSPFKKELPDLYMRLALTQLNLGQVQESDKTFSKTLSLEREKEGFHSAVVLLFWGWFSLKNNQLPKASEKLNKALLIARALSEEKRGTVVIDAAKLMATVDDYLGKKQEGESFRQEFMSEVKIQKNLKQHLGPNLYFQHSI